MNTSLPQVLSDYFNAVNDGRIDDATACFAPDAKVNDEQRNYAGETEIKTWIAQSTDEYHPQTEILELVADGNDLLIKGKVSGTFPGSPITLDYRFNITNDQISSLSIG